ncbi:hypothetical protein GH733_003090 [Mirounga leonina]|nr:hypothetical protein GH733_003090 [Mirounga leonina]
MSPTGAESSTALPRLGEYRASWMKIRKELQLRNISAFLMYKIGIVHIGILIDELAFHLLNCELLLLGTDSRVEQTHHSLPQHSKARKGTQITRQGFNQFTAVTETISLLVGFSLRCNT